jgi:hypothetical protein
MIDERIIAVDDYIQSHDEWYGYADLLVVPPSPEDIIDEFFDADQEVVERCYYLWKQEPIEITRGALYVMTRRKGNNDKMAAMIAMQKTPRGMTDDVFWEGIQGRGRGMFLADQFEGEPHYFKALMKAAKAQGFTPNQGDFYDPGLARHLGDPLAFIPRSGARGHVKKVCEMRGLPCHGAVNIKGRSIDVDPLEKAPALHEDIIRHRIKEKAAGQPLTKKKLQNLREEVVATHGAKKGRLGMAASSSITPSDSPT